MAEPAFGGCWENLVKFGGGAIMIWAVFQRFRHDPLSSLNLNAAAHQDIVDNDSNFVGGSPFSVSA